MIDVDANVLAFISSRENARQEDEDRRQKISCLIAHLYGLTEEEFAHILKTFPLVPDPVKIAAHNAFRNVEKGLIK